MDKRSILWRGKTTPKPNGEEFNNVWVKGDLIRSANRYYIHPVANAVKVQNELGRLIVMHEVDPLTLGRCIGSTDVKGNLIFEGDILLGAWNERLVVYYDDCYMGFRVINAAGYEKDISYYDNGRLVVIGNIHENPELLNATGEDIGNAAQDTLAPAT